MIAKKSFHSAREQFHIQREIDIQSKLLHPHIISVYEGACGKHICRVIRCHCTVSCCMCVIAMKNGSDGLFIFLVSVRCSSIVVLLLMFKQHTYQSLYGTVLFVGIVELR